MQLQFDKARWMRDSDGEWLCIRTHNGAQARQFVDSMRPKTYNAELKEDRKKRSTEANNYCWALLDKLAVALGSTKEELYLGFVRKCGTYRDFHLLPEEAPSFCAGWSMLGTGWPTEQVDYTHDGERLVIRAYYGSSTYNTKRMARFIDEIVSECKLQGVETLPPDRLDAMKEAWT